MNDTADDLDFEEQAIQRLMGKLRRLQARSVAHQLDLIRSEFPQIYGHAERFVRGTHRLPWEIAEDAEELAGEVQEIYEIYGGRPTSQRPHSLDVAFGTDLFVRVQVGAGRAMR